MNPWGLPGVFSAYTQQLHDPNTQPSTSYQLTPFLPSGVCLLSLYKADKDDLLKHETDIRAEWRLTRANYGHIIRGMKASDIGVELFNADNRLLKDKEGTLRKMVKDMLKLKGRYAGLGV